MVHKFIGNNPLGVDLERCSAAAEFPLGMVVEGLQADGTFAKYRYVQFLDAVTYVAGHVVCMDSATTWGVSNDVSANMAGDHPVGVVFQATVPTENQYGWVQISGIATVLIGSAAVIAGDYLKADASTDGAADEATAGTDENLVGVALATIADAATGRVMLMIRNAA